MMTIMTYKFDDGMKQNNRNVNLVFSAVIANSESYSSTNH